MKLLEYEAKKILEQYHIAIPRSYIANESAEFLPAVLKSQVPIGGRGKAGGVVVISTQEDFTAALKHLRNLSIKGYMPKTILAEEVISIDKEFYVAVLINKSTATIEIVAHTNGGVEVEANNSSEFLRIEITDKNTEAVGEQLADYFDLPDKTFLLQDIVERLYACFVKNDATLLEINPLILTKQGDIIAGDCKMELDDTATFRHPEWKFEQASSESNFVTLDNNGTVATVANGAGLAMATVDAVAGAGMKPANFLDIGGGANEASIFAAFERILEYPNVKVIIINIFAGITRCDEVAKAIIAAQARLPHLPALTIRLAGTNYEEAAELLDRQDIPTLPTLEECVTAAKKAIL